MDTLRNSAASRLLRNPAAGYIAAIVGVALVTIVLEPIHLSVSATTVALSLLLVVLVTASLWGSRPAALASVLSVLSFNFFFLPPVGTWTIADPENWFALAAFLVTAVIAGQLSAYAKRRAEIAEARRIEIERLYRELSDAFEKASHAEALRQSEKLKSALLDAVSHDIRTPLTAIKASVTTLLDERAGEEKGEAFKLDEESRREMLDVINEETDRLDRFVEDLVELARIEAGEIKLRRQPARIEEIIADAAARADTLTAGHKLTIDIADGLPPVEADSKAISEVVYTLLDNAAKYSPKGSTIRVSAESRNASAVSVGVEDEGAGVPTELRERIFDKFFRAIHDTESGTRHAGGTGMGLAIARGIIEAHNGHIFVTDPAEGRHGARFEFSLPVKK